MSRFVSRSPDGRFIIEADGVPQRMSHVTFPPVVRDLEDDAALVDLSQTLWSVERAEWDGHVSSVTLRKYRTVGPGEYRADRHRPVTAQLDLEGGTAEIDGRIAPLTDLEAALDDALIPGDEQPYAALLRDSLAVLEDASLRADVYHLQRDLEVGTRPLQAIERLFLPTGELHDDALEGGWVDAFEDLAVRADRLKAFRTASVLTPSTAMRKGSRRSPPRIVVLVVGAIGIVAAAAWLGGTRAAVGVGAIVLGLLLPVIVAVVGFVRNPVGTLLRGPSKFRSRLRRSWSARILLGLEVALVVVGVAVLIRGC